MTFSAAFRERFEILRILGAGSLGEVYLAREISLDRPVAIRSVPASAFARGRDRERFLREARESGRLSHPCIVKVLEQGEDEGRLYLVLEHVDGGDLAKLLAERAPLAGPLFFQIALPLVDAVAHAHRAGLLHRDLKASNVLLDAQLNPRLTDFGLVRVAGDVADDDPGPISPFPLPSSSSLRYVAPEHAIGEPASAATDQYALGVLLYELLAGVPPFDAPQPAKLLRMHVEDPPPPLSRHRADLPPALAAAVQRALAKSPAERWPSVAKLHDALAELEARGEPWRARVPSPSREPAARGASDANSDATTDTPAPPVPPAAAPSAAAPRTGGDTLVVGTPAVPVRSRPSGRSRAHTGSDTLVVARPEAGRAPSRPRVAIALAGLCIALTVIGLVVERANRSDHRYADLVFRLERGRHHGTLRWDPALPAATAGVRCTSSPSASASASHVSSVRLPGLGMGDVALDVELTDPSGHLHRFQQRQFPAVTLELLDAQLTIIRNVPGAEAASEEERAWPLEDRLTYRFTNALNAVFGRRPTRTERYSTLSQDQLARAAARSGMDRAIAWYRDNRLESVLEQAAALLGEPGDWRTKGSILANAHAIANVEAFLLSSGFLIPAPALRFQYGLKPGPMPGPRRVVLDGPGDFSRSAWYSKLVFDPYEVKTARQSLADGKDATRWHVRSVSYQDAAPPRKAVEGDPVAGIMAETNSDEGFPPEYHKEKDAIVHEWSQMVLVPVPLKALKLPPPRTNVTGASFLLHVRAASELVHVDVTAGPAVFCFRTPPGYIAYRDVLAWGPDVRAEDLPSSDPLLSSESFRGGAPTSERPGLLHVARFDAAALSELREHPVISVHCPRGDGLLDKPVLWMPSWKAFISMVGLRYEQDPGEEPTGAPRTP